jgi:hypothetical protein
MEKKYNSKLEYISGVMEEMCMGSLTFIVAVTVVASLFFLGR